MKFLQTFLIFTAALLVLSILPDKVTSQVISKVDTSITNKLSTDLQSLVTDYRHYVSKTEPCNCKPTQKDPPCKYSTCTQPSPNGGNYTKLDRGSGITPADSVEYEKNSDSLHAVVNRVYNKVMELKKKVIYNTETSAERKDLQILEMIMYEAWYNNY